MEMMRNPHAMQQAMRNQDLQMSHIENIPGGFNALRRMYEEVHEPMMEASQSMAMGAGTAGGPSASSSNAPSSAAAPTNSALPNPWGQRPNGSTTSDAPHANPFGAAFPGGPGLGSLPSMDPAQMNAMMQNPMMQQMMQQMLQDPNALEQVTSHPSVEDAVVVVEASHHPTCRDYYRSLCSTLNWAPCSGTRRCVQCCPARSSCRASVTQR